MPWGKALTDHPQMEWLMLLAYPYAPWCWYIYLHGWVIYGVNVGKYTIHGAYGLYYFEFWWLNSITSHFFVGEFHEISIYLSEFPWNQHLCCPLKPKKKHLKRRPKSESSCSIWFSARKRRSERNWDTCGWIAARNQASTPNIMACYFIFITIYLYGYGSIPINTIFRGMNIHLPAILMFTRGTRFWHTAI